MPSSSTAGGVGVGGDEKRGRLVGLVDLGGWVGSVGIGGSVAWVSKPRAPLSPASTYETAQLPETTACATAVSASEADSLANGTVLSVSSKWSVGGQSVVGWWSVGGVRLVAVGVKS